MNNAFLIATRHELARLYNDTSVLESHHLATMYGTLAGEGLNLFARLEDGRWRELRKHIISTILHTDMTYHFPLVSKAIPLCNPQSCLQRSTMQSGFIT